eukprot:gene9322-10305_t
MSLNNKPNSHEVSVVKAFPRFDALLHENESLYDRIHSPFWIVLPRACDTQRYTCGSAISIVAKQNDELASPKVKDYKEEAADKDANNEPKRVQAIVAVVMFAAADILVAADMFAADILAADMFAADMFAVDILAADMFAADILAADMFAADMFAVDILAADMFAADILAADMFAADMFAAEAVAAAGLGEK